MPFYHQLGSVPRKRHIVFRRPDGGLYAEELMGHEGFVGTSSLLYHTHPPTTVLSARKLRDIVLEADTDTSLRHRHFLTARGPTGGSATLDRMPLLFNSDIVMQYVEPDQLDAHFYRNSQADEVVYVVEGTGVLESVFGELPYKSGDYVVIHRNITHRWRLDVSQGPTKLLVMESRGHVRVPIRRFGGRTQFILSHIAGKDGRLVREQEKPLEQFGLCVADIQGERRFALVQMRQQPVNQRDFGLRFRIPHPRFFLLGRALLLQSGQICQDQLRRNRLDVPHRINRAGHMVDVAILKTADHLHNGVHLANMTEKLISQSLALARPFD